MQDSPPEERTPLILIDESLADRPLAQALRLLDYNAEYVSERFGQGALDTTLIQWLGLQKGIWITLDEKAKWQHAQVIKDAGIHIVWIRRRKEGMSKEDQLLLILWIIDDVLRKIAEARGPLYFKAYFSGVRPKLEQV